MTVNDLIRSALRAIGDLGVGQQFSADDYADALFVLNAMIDAWNIEKLTIFDIGQAVYPLTPGQQTYTFGPGGNFNAPRPNRITAANLVYSVNGSAALFLALQMLSLPEWAGVRMQNLGSPIPTQIYAEPSFPLMNVSFLPFPTSGQAVQFYTWTPLGAFVNQTDPVSVPPGYADAIRYNLAIRLAAEWGRPLPAEVAELASRAKAAIQNQNLPAPVMQCDPAITGPRRTEGRSNILTGWY